MPRYKYRCDFCAHEWAEWHSMGELPMECPSCFKREPNSIIRVPPSFVHKKSRKPSGNRKVGEVSREYIEENRKILRSMRKETLEGDVE